MSLASVTGQGSAVTIGESVQLFPTWGTGWVFSVTGRIVSVTAIRDDIVEDLERFDGLSVPNFSALNTHWTDLLAIQQMLIRCEINEQPWNINSEPIDHIAALRNFALNSRQRNAPKVGVYTVDWNTWIPERFAFNSYLVSARATINSDPFHPYNDNADVKYKSLRGHADSYRTGDRFIVDEYTGNVIRLSDGVTWVNPYGGTVVKFNGVDREAETVTFNTGDVFSMDQWKWLVNTGDSGDTSSGGQVPVVVEQGAKSESLIEKYFRLFLTDTKIQIGVLAVMLLLAYIIRIRK